MRLANQILTMTALAGLLWALSPQVAAADTRVSTAQLRVSDSDGLPVSEVRYPYRGYYRPYASPYVARSYGYGPYFGGYGSYNRTYVSPYASPYYAARPYYGYGYAPRFNYGYARPRYAYRYRW